MEKESINLSNYLAGERTMLAWIRTGLALMGFGFVVARFGLFLRELTKVGFNVATRTGMSLWIGIGLVSLGILTVTLSTFQHYKGIKSFKSGGNYVSALGSKLVWIVPIFLVFFGAWMLIYLISLQGL
jgi:putative membrane protein